MESVISAAEGVKKRTRSSSKTPTTTSSATEKTKTAPMGLFRLHSLHSPWHPELLNGRGPRRQLRSTDRPLTRVSHPRTMQPHLFSLSVRSQPILTLSQEASAQEPTATLKTSAAKKFEITLKGPSSPSQPS